MHSTVEPSNDLGIDDHFVPIDRLRKVSVIPEDHIKHLKLTYERAGKEVDLELDPEELENPLGAILALSVIAPSTIDESVEPYLDPDRIIGESPSDEVRECALDMQGACPLDRGLPCSLTGGESCFLGYREREATWQLADTAKVDGAIVLGMLFLGLLSSLLFTQSADAIRDPTFLNQSWPELVIFYFALPLIIAVVLYGIIGGLRESYRGAWDSSVCTVVPGGVFVPIRLSHRMMLRAGPIVPLSSIKCVERRLWAFFAAHEHYLYTVGGDRFAIEPPLFTALAGVQGFERTGFKAINTNAAKGPQRPPNSIDRIAVMNLIAGWTLVFLMAAVLPTVLYAIVFLVVTLFIMIPLLVADFRMDEVEHISHGLRIREDGISIPLAEEHFRSIKWPDMRSATVVRWGGSLALAVDTAEGIVHLPISAVEGMRGRGREVRDPEHLLAVDD